MVQLRFPEPRTWGGRRKGAGRKRVGRPNVAHARRPAHAWWKPVHVTLRRCEELVQLRRRDVFPSLRDAIAAASKDDFRVIQFSVQKDHVHFLVEANDRAALVRGLRGLTIRTAKAISRALHRRGRVWGDRYHARALSTPKEVRNAIVYVLLNVRHHLPYVSGLDPCSSAEWFPWQNHSPSSRPPPIRPPQTWLAREGWLRHGPLRA